MAWFRLFASVVIERKGLDTSGPILSSSRSVIVARARACRGAAVQCREPSHKV